MDSEKREDKELTETELAIVALVAEGKTNKEIAKELNYSLDTIKTYMKYIFKKLNATSRTHIATKYIKTEADQE